MKPDIFEILYRKYYKTAYIYTFSLCKSKEMTEDIVSDAFEKAFNYLDDEINHFKYWLLVVCKNLWLNKIKKRNQLLSSSMENELIATEKVLDKILQKERNQQIYKCIMKLSQRYQEILVLYYFGEIPLAEISKIMNITSGNAKTLLFRARAGLKKIMEEDDYEF